MVKNIQLHICKSGIVPTRDSRKKLELFSYTITELETLAVVWAITHFHDYIYGQDVEEFTDHSAVKAVLQTPSANSKHARWWSKIFGSGARSGTGLARITVVLMDCHAFQ